MTPFIAIAPMEGVVDSIVRDLLTSIGGLDRTVTEFIRVTDRLLPPHVFYKYSPELRAGGQTPSGIPVFVQLLGGQVEPMADNASLAAEIGAPGIDVNFGCPAKTVNRHDGGATILKNPDRIFKILSRMRQRIRADIPLTAKVRLGFEHKLFVKDIAQAAEAGGASALTVHARTKLEMYQPPAHWEYIGKMRAAVRIPVIANGDIWSVEDYQRCREISGCEAIALGRGLMANPYLALKIRSELAGLDDKVLRPWCDISFVLKKFIYASQAKAGEAFACARLKQWLKALGRNYPEAQKLFATIKTLKSSSAILAALGEGDIYGEDSYLHVDPMPLLRSGQEPIKSQANPL